MSVYELFERPSYVVFHRLLLHVCLLFIVMCAFDMLLINATQLRTYCIITVHLSRCKAQFAIFDSVIKITTDYENNQENCNENDRSDLDT